MPQPTPIVYVNQTLLHINTPENRRQFSVEVLHVELQPNRMCKAGTFLPGKRQTTKNDHSPSGKEKNAWSYTSTPHAFMA